MDITRSLTVLVILYSVQATAQMKQTQEAMRCVEKLIPCHPYIKTGSPPPPWCCNPMKEIVEKDTTCLCGFLNHPDMLALINITQDDALNLISSCGASYDESLCSNNTVSSPEASTGATTTESSSGSTTKNAALAISLLGFSLIWL
ncbi:non-specific lipid transfer protein GPI-anchored 8 [Raphanus sativus]|uniref:Non-specific lipid transfer protein GPI-anchored 8 n=1 Tax=Raphanus sativus TaxID=3726 RepID=A0A6J0MBS1_RAPSA|nr:non-specific lipid transfer protein GPI-anchored 8 [Raphanus sativus]